MSRQKITAETVIAHEQVVLQAEAALTAACKALKQARSDAAVDDRYSSSHRHDCWETLAINANQLRRKADATAALAAQLIQELGRGEYLKA